MWQCYFYNKQSQAQPIVHRLWFNLIHIFRHIFEMRLELFQVLFRDPFTPPCFHTFRSNFVQQIVHLTINSYMFHWLPYIPLSFHSTTPFKVSSCNSSGPSIFWHLQLSPAVSLSLSLCPAISKHIHSSFAPANSLSHSLYQTLPTDQSSTSSSPDVHHSAHFHSLTSQETIQFLPYFSLTHFASLFHQLNHFSHKLILFLFLLQPLPIYTPRIHLIRCTSPCHT